MLNELQASPNLIARFWSKVNQEGGIDGCWLWTGGQSNGRYGVFGVGGRSQLAHRVAYRLGVGPIPGGQCVCHRCDTPLCVNPTHLFLGTIADNNHDAQRKGRLRQSPSRVILTLTQRQLIESAPRTRCVRRDLARRFGVSVNYIERLRLGDYKGSHREALRRGTGGAL